MAHYSGASRTNVKNLGKVRGQLGNLKDELEVKRGGHTMMFGVLNSMLTYGESKMRTVYYTSGVENADEIRIRHNIEDGWGRIHAKGDGLFFVEFGTGVNNNSGTSRGAILGFTPTSWSTGESGKGYLTGNRFVLFQGWWPVKKGVPNAQKRLFVTSTGKLIERRAVQGNPPVNATEAAVTEILFRTPTSITGHFKIQQIFK